jgi:hypothetical protein
MYKRHTTPWDDRELDDVDDAAWERFNRRREDTQRRMRLLEADFIQRWIDKEAMEDNGNTV